MAFDLVIRDGMLVDGTGSPARRADIGISGDRVVEIGSIPQTNGARVINADGRIVTPGFVDIHSHLDAQVGWDPTMSSSCWHGITSTVMGNCGMTFAPIRPGDAELLATAMESVEDIPASSILQGLSWEWESYSEYLDMVAALPLGLNTGGYVGDVALRLYVAGEASCEPDFAASPAQLGEMAALVEQAMQAGALGYSISRSLFHRVPDGRNVPGTWSDPSEFFAIAESLGRLQRGVLESAPRYNEVDGSGSRVAEELTWMAELSRSTGRPFCFNLQQINSLGNHYREVIERSQAANATGAQLRPQITPRSVGVLFSFAANTIIDDLPSFSRLAGLTLPERLNAIRDSEFRAQLIAEGAHKTPEGYETMYLMRSEAPATYEYAPEDSIAHLARISHKTVVEMYLDEMLASEGKSLVNWPVMNQRSDALEEMISADVTIMGLADAGAHATQIMDASQPTYFLSHWARDKGLISLEQAVRALSGDTAEFIGYRDRGTVEVGSFADINIIDYENLSLELPEIVRDFPGNAPRFIQRAHGFDATIVNGEVFMDHGEHTGSLSGRVLRSTD
ncbi:MAG TPA: amidohydrolase [Acidimicrobiaceae bacterium]|jgi:N-acyl-D-aspartate/D-glutamate deacylase|nr:amidohydrolase [Acidimicrobiaceae bacterium]